MSDIRGAIDAAVRVRKPLLLDAALGTDLEHRGVATPAPLWSANALLTQPSVVAEIHRENAAAGADILTANTFRLNPRALRMAGIESRGAELIAAAIKLAVDAGAPSVVASVAPVEDCYRPDLAPDDAELRAEHGLFADQLAEAGADAAWIETMNTGREAIIAAQAARDAGLPFIVSFVPREDGAILSGDNLRDAAREALELGAIAVGVNCAPPSALDRILRTLQELNAPLIAYGHLSARPTPGWGLCESLSPIAYARTARVWTARRAAIIGGCCGTSADTTAALRQAIDAM
ncbi:MAG: homocysteine S-methyltransferase family protein [Phycisphaerales bacterium]|nr:homocysteine S-methyltransferase family protein [Phycisphaerales bacterium]